MACTDKESLEFYAGGNDWEALCKAKARCVVVMNNPSLSWFERERAREMLSARSIVELENVRAAWAEISEALAALPAKV